MIFRALVFLPAISLFAQVPANLPPLSTFLKADVSVQQVAADAKGFVYLLGTTAATAANGYPNQIFVTRVDPVTAVPTYTTYLTGGTNPSSATFASALAVDAAGNAYVAWYTSLANQPLPAPSSGNTPRVTKIDSNGNTVYSFQFPAAANAQPLSIAIDGQGEAVVSGATSNSNFPVTSGAYSSAIAPYFTAKIDAAGSSLIFSAIGIGGSSLAMDAAGNIFIAGTATGLAPNGSAYPTTAGAFQQSFTPDNLCSGPTCFYTFTVGEQYVTKLSPDGSTLLYSTYVSGSHGAYNHGMAIDAAGDVWLTGGTNSPDYPITNGQGVAVSKAFTTELDPTGSKVLLSVPVGVTNANGLSIDAQGNIVLAGVFGPPPSPDAIVTDNSFLAPPPAAPPGASPHCIPSGASFVDGAVYAMRLSSQDGSVMDTRVYSGLGGGSSTLDAAGNLYLAGGVGLPTVPLTPGIVFDSAAGVPGASGAYLARTSFSARVSAVGCVTDSTSATLIGPVAPGQLITIYGNNIGPRQPADGIANGATSVPTSLTGDVVTFGGQPAPILYASSTQINVQVPFEVAPRASTVMQLSFNGSILGARSLAVTPLNPSLFTATDAPADQNCGGTTGGTPGQIAFAMNEDGTLNSCASPAKVGSQITLFVNGIGATAPNSVTGALTGANPGNVSASVTFADNAEVDAFTNQAGAISGIAALTVRVPNTYPVEFTLSPLNIGITVNGLTAGPVADTPLVIFAEP